MKDYEFHPEALEEMRNAGHFYDGKQAGLGDDFLDETHAAIDRSREGIVGGSPWIHQTFLWTVHRFPYGVVYREYPDKIHIIAVYHFSQPEDYWVHRLDDIDD